MSYTKGPWKHDDVWALIKGPKGEEVAAIHSGQNDGERVDRNIAYENATLIAAAPDLVEALELCQSYIKGLLDCPPNEVQDILTNTGEDLEETINQALTNAKGGQP